MASSLLNIETIKSAVDTAGGFLLGNRYLVSFTGIGSAVSSIFSSNSNLTMFANAISVPSLTLSCTEANIFGQSVSVPNRYSEETVTVSFYNTGSEYNLWYNYFKSVYNPIVNGARFYAYRDDIIFNMIITEYNSASEAIAKYECIDCIATKLDGITMSFDAPSTVQKFNVTVNTAGVSYTKM